MNPSTAQGRVLLDELARGGVRHAVIAPGSRSAPLTLAADHHDRVTVHVEIDERSAAFLALGIARATGGPAAVICSSGTAAVNFHPAVVEAHHARVPLLVLTADRPPELRATGANQTIAQPGLYGGATRWAVDLSVAERRRGEVGYWRSVAARAVAEATGPPAGPVHVNVGLRDPLVPEGEGGDGWVEPLDGRPGGRPWAVRTRDLALPAPTQVDLVADLVAAHPRGVLVLGDVAVDPVVVAGFAAAAGWPVVAEPLSGARSGDHAISTADLLLADPAFADAHRPDLALVVGRPVLTRGVRRWLDATPRTVVIDADGAWLDPGRTVERIVRADPAAVLRDVCARCEPRVTHFLAQWQHAERAARGAVDGLLDDLAEPSEPRIARDLAACLPDGAALVVGSSMPVRDLSAFMRPRRGLRVVGNRGASGIDGFVSTALGVAIGHDGPVAALGGDLSLLHDQNGFLLDRGAALDVVFVVVNNDGGGIFSLLEARRARHFDRLFGTPHGIGFGALAATYGLAYHPLARAADLADVVRSALDAGGPHLIEARTDREHNAALHRELTAAVADAVGT